MCCSLTPASAWVYATHSSTHDPKYQKKGPSQASHCVMSFTSNLVVRDKRERERERESERERERECVCTCMSYTQLHKHTNTHSHSHKCLAAPRFAKIQITDHFLCMPSQGQLPETFPISLSLHNLYTHTHTHTHTHTYVYLNRVVLQ